MNVPIEGTFSQFELMKVENPNEKFIVEKVLRRQRRNNKPEYFVKLLGYFDKFNDLVDNINSDER